MKKRVVSWLLAVVMLVSLLPTAVWAESTSSGAEVYVTISVQGDLKTKGLAVGLSDLDNDEKLTVNDALIAAHNEAYEGGADAGYGYCTGTYGLSMSKLWGNNSGAFMYYKNNVSCWSLADEVNAGDHITAFVYKDVTYWSDIYSYFDADKKVVAAGNSVTLTLYYNTYDTDYNVIRTALSDATITVDGTEQSPKTDRQGSVALTFNTPGDYVISASKEISTTAWDYNNNTSVSVNAVLVPPVCVVTVLSEADYNAACAVVNTAKGQLTWDSLTSEQQNAVTTGFTLPTTLTVGTGTDAKTVSVSWTKTNSALSIWGSSVYVDCPVAQDATGTLTATLTYAPSGGGTFTDTVVFDVTVKAEGVNSDKTSVVDFKTLMDNIATGYTSSTEAPTVLDMAGYGKNVKTGTGYVDSSHDAMHALAACAIGESADTYLEALKKYDTKTEYASGIYSAPYVLLAYDAANVTDDSSFTCTRAALKNAMVTFLNSLQGGSDVDAVPPMLAALAPYYGKSDSNLNAAVNKAVTWLSEQQQSDGTFAAYDGTSNSNTTALAVVGLTALGIDAHRDSRFIRNGHSALEGLLSFALADCSGFGYKGNVTKNDYGTEQSFRALVSYARFAENNGKAYNIYLDAKVTGTTAAPADPEITTTVKPAPVTPEADDTTITVSLTVRGNGSTWLTRSVSVKKGVSVYDVLTSVLRENGYTWEGTSSYISYITNPSGTRLGEFSTGSNSGWLYKVNGVLPSLPVGEYTLSNGDSILFYYTNDWMKDPAASAMASQDQDDKKDETDTTAQKTSNGTTAAAGSNAWQTAYSKTLAAAAQRELTFGDEWLVIALARSGKTIPDSYYDSVVKAVQDAGGDLSDTKYTEYSRTILALTAIGKDPTDVGGYDLLAKLADMDKVTYQGINGAIFALIALDSGAYDVPADADAATPTSRESLVAYLLAAQLADGGWALGGTGADTDVTAMALQALAKYYGDDAEVKAAVDAALTTLSGMQLKDGGFGSWGTVNSESCAQVIIALTALGIDPLTDSRFIKNGRTLLDALYDFYLDGAFRHSADGAANDMATEQALCALTAYSRFAGGLSALYDMNETTEPAAADDVDVSPAEEPEEGGSTTSVVVWIALGAAAVAAGAAVVIVRRRKE